MSEKEIIEQFQSMVGEAKKLIDKGESKAAFMEGISEAAVGICRADPSKVKLVKQEAEKAIEEIAKYKHKEG